MPTHSREVWMHIKGTFKYEVGDDNEIVDVTVNEGVQIETNVPRALVACAMVALGEGLLNNKTSVTETVTKVS